MNIMTGLFFVTYRICVKYLSTAVQITVIIFTGCRQESCILGLFFIYSAIMKLLNVS